MCLSNVYRNQIGDDNLLLSNVQRIESHGGRGNLELSFLDYSMDEKPKYTVEECKERDATYAKPIKIRL